MSANSSWSWQTLTKNLVFLTIPLLISQIVQIGNAVIDMVFAGRVGVHVLGAITVGSTLAVAFLSFLMGLLYIMVPFIGKLRGEGKTADIINVLAQALFIGLGVSVVIAVILYFGCEPLYKLFNVEPTLIPDATRYTRIISLGFPAMGLFLPLRFLMDASSKPMWVAFVVILTIAIKVFAMFTFVFGWTSVPPNPTKAVLGFGYATLLSFWVSPFLMYVICRYLSTMDFVWSGTFKRTVLSAPQLTFFVKNGLPIGFNFLSEFLVLTIITLFVASMSTIAVTSHQITFNFLTIAVLLPTALGMASTILISHVAGSFSRDGVRKTLLLSLGSVVVIGIVSSVLIYFYQADIPLIYTNDPQVQALAQTLVSVLSWILLIDILVVVLSFLLRGLGDPFGPFYVLLIAHWMVTLPLGYAISTHDWIVSSQGVVGWWYALGIGLSIAVILLGLRLQKAYKALPF